MMIESTSLTRAFEAKIDDVSTPRRTVTAKINTNCVDRYNTVIVPRGGDWSNFMRSGPAVLWEHGNDPNRGRLPIAHCNSLKYRKTDDDILGVMRFKGDDFSDQVMGMYVDGTLRSFSVEFLPDTGTSGRPTQEEVRANPTWGAAHTIYRSWELTGFSAVSYPGNPEALAVAVGRGLWVPEETRRQLGLSRASEDSDDNDDGDRALTWEEAKESDPEEFEGLDLSPEDAGDEGEDFEERSLVASSFLALPRFNPNHDAHSGQFSSGGMGDDSGSWFEDEGTPSKSEKKPESGKGMGKLKVPSNMKGPGVLKTTLTPRVTTQKRSDGGVQYNHAGKAVAWSQPSKTGKYWITARPAGSSASGKGIHTTSKGTKTSEESIYNGGNRQAKAAKRAEGLARDYKKTATTVEKEKIKDADKFDVVEHISGGMGKGRYDELRKHYHVKIEFTSKPAGKGRSVSMDTILDRLNEMDGRLRAMSEGNGSQGGYTTKTKDDDEDDSEYDRYITHDDGQYVVHAEDGKVLGKHKTKADAVAQLQAIEISKHKKSLSESREEERDAPLPVIQTFTLQEMNQKIVESALPMFRMMYFAAQARTAQDLEDLARGRV